MALTCVALLIALAASGATKRVQSPRAISQQPAVSYQPVEEPSTFNLQPSTFASITASAVAPATNRTVNVTFAWDASQSPGITNYSLSYGIAPRNYTNSQNFRTNLTGTVSNLAARTRYYFAARASTAQATSDFSAEITWPQYVTNYIGVGIKTNGRVITQLTYTNPPGDVVLFEPFIWQTNDAVSVHRLNTKGLIVGNTNQP